MSHHPQITKHTKPTNLCWWNELERFTLEKFNHMLKKTKKESHIRTQNVFGKRNPYWI